MSTGPVRIILSFLVLSLLVVSGAVAAPEAGTAGSRPVFEDDLIPRSLPRKPAMTTLSPDADISRVVVKFKDDLKVSLRAGGLYTNSTGSISSASSLLEPYLDSRLERLFGRFSEEKLSRDHFNLQLKSGHQLPDLNSYFTIELSNPNEATQLVNGLNRLEEVEIAYAQPEAIPANILMDTTPDFVSWQNYREAAPDGIDADFAAGLAGGDGSGVRIVDIEGNWQFTHEDLGSAVGGLIGGELMSSSLWRNHGTAVIGVLIGTENGLGITGVSPGAQIGMISIGGISTAEAIYLAIDSLDDGDVILIELQAAGPHYNFQSRPDQLGYICMEYWQANYDAMLYAWARGITVIEPAGNGREDLDDFGLYGSLFDTAFRNSHAIIVGAGAPPSSQNNLQREVFSNYGQRVNLQSNGSGVYTTGYGDLFDGGGNEDRFFTATFNGTSSAGAIVAGAAACLQGYYLATYGGPLTSDAILKLLVATGTAQQGNLGEHIGPRPDLMAAIAASGPPQALYTNPTLIDTAVFEGSQENIAIYLHNRSATETVDFSIVDNDSLAAKLYVNWLVASPITGSIGPTDSVRIELTLDATTLDFETGQLVGALQISWGLIPGELDSLAWLPIYMQVLCNDTSYRAIRSDEPGGPIFEWISAKELGLKIPNGSFFGGNGSPLDDGSAGPRNINFIFPYYDSSYSRVYVGINGALSMTEHDLNIDGLFAPIQLPDSQFTTFFAPLWNDLVLDTSVSGAGVYYHTLPGGTTVFEWYHLSNKNDPSDSLTDFEIILTANGKITYQYQTIEYSAMAQTSLIGCSEKECRVVSHFNNGDQPVNQPYDGLAILFENTDGEYVPSGDVNGGGTLDVADITYLVEYLFRGGPPPVSTDEGDINCSGGIDVADLTYLVDYLFIGGPLPCHYLSIN